MIADTFVGTTRAGASALARKGYEMSEELKPCPVPWCRSDTVRLVVCYPDMRDGYVICEKCRLKGPIKRKAEAVAAWNARDIPATPEPSEAVVERVARALYECERKRHDHASAVLSVAANKAVSVDMEPWEEYCEIYRGDARAALSAMPNPKGGWMPIETAPKGTLLVFIPMADQPSNLPKGRTVIAYRQDHDGVIMSTWCYAVGPGAGKQCGWPTHWMPLPAAPDDISTGQGEES